MWSVQYCKEGAAFSYCHLHLSTIVRCIYRHPSCEHKEKSAREMFVVVVVVAFRSIFSEEPLCTHLFLRAPIDHPIQQPGRQDLVIVRRPREKILNSLSDQSSKAFPCIFRSGRFDLQWRMDQNYSRARKRIHIILLCRPQSSKLQYWFNKQQLFLFLTKLLRPLLCYAFLPSIIIIIIIITIIIQANK